MNSLKELLEIKKTIKKKRPNFIRQDAFKRKRLSMNWRAPAGGQSKTRKKKRGKVACPGPAFASPREVRGLTMQGLRPIEVETMKGLEKLDPKTETAVIKSVGQKRRMELVKYALSKKITILNIKKPEEFLKSKEEELAKRRESTKKKEELKKHKKEEALKKAESEKKEEKEEGKGEEAKPETAKGAKSEKIKALEKKQ